MRISGDQTLLSASDLANHLGCRHLTSLNEAAARGQLAPPVWNDPLIEMLQQRGREHETAFVGSLRRQGLAVAQPVASSGETGVEATIRAMRAGPDVIVQATLERGRWFGRADVLRRTEQPSRLGPYSYEVVDTKLARDTRAGAILQLCLYSEIVADFQGLTPELMHVVSPGHDFCPESFRLTEFLAYHRFVKRSLERAVETSGVGTYPEPVALCEMCRWWSACDSRWRADDHLSLVAGISRTQRRELEVWGVGTLAELAVLPIPLQRHPRRGARASYEDIREQARVQLEARERGEPVFELLPRMEGRGLGLLPPPSLGDVFFDIEGDPFALEGGLEYLLGWAVAGEGGEVAYQRVWANSRGEERAAFEHFVDTVISQRRCFPGMHVYHFTAYEPSALKRLMGRFGSRQDEIDDFLREGVLVDLHRVVKQALRAGVENYSIKNLEYFYGFRRDEELRAASRALRLVERALELGQPEVITDELRRSIETYNRDDCISTLRLREWLEALRSELLDGGEDVARPEAPEPETDREEDAEVRLVMDRLLDGLPDDRAERTVEQQACWLLAHMLEWHRREGKAPWWEYFRLVGLSDDELLEERSAVAHLEFVEVRGGTAQCPVHRYVFARQDTDVRRGDPLKDGVGQNLGSVDEIDPVARTIDVKKTGAMAEVHPASVFAHEVITTKEQAAALLRIGQWVAHQGIDEDGPYRAGRDLILRRQPRRRPDVASTPLAQVGESALDSGKRLASELDGGVLAIQGPPGAGKTFTGARMICELVRAGKKVGITALSHKVIRNLLDRTVGAAEEQCLAIQCTQKVGQRPTRWDGEPIREVRNNSDVVNQLNTGEAQVAAGTPWLWSREEFAEAVDVLFVDEAGQMSLANVIAISQAADSIVLLGDPQQLEQPLQGTHPEGTEVSALEHLILAERTIPEDLGLFLPETWRLVPEICAFTSELFYDGRLNSHESLWDQALEGGGDFSGAGLLYAPVLHDGNSSSSPEEAERVAQIWEQLTGGAVEWRNPEGSLSALGPDDILIVAPYNAQVSEIGELVPQARVGTVDKFQGQEAPVVIYSMATSTPEEAPRGMEFLYSPNRLNVAISRARCRSILVANPRLFEPECRTPRQMKLANAFCRYVEMATQIAGS